MTVWQLAGLPESSRRLFRPSEREKGGETYLTPCQLCDVLLPIIPLAPDEFVAFCGFFEDLPVAVGFCGEFFVGFSRWYTAAGCFNLNELVVFCFLIQYVQSLDNG